MQHQKQVGRPSAFIMQIQRKYYDMIPCRQGSNRLFSCLEAGSGSGAGRPNMEFSESSCLVVAG